MKRNVLVLLMAWAGIAGTAAAQTVFRLPGLEPAGPETGLVEVGFSHLVSFSVEDPRVALLQLQIRDETGMLLFDSGLVQAGRVEWAPEDWEWAGRRYDLFAWGAAGQSVGFQSGQLLMTETGPEARPLAYNITGNFSVSGSLGIGTDQPERAVHIKGSNAVFRMDRSTNSAAFMMVRTDTLGQPLKTYVLGVDASGANNGQFVINDLGQSTGGGGSRRMTIGNTGNVVFTGSVTAAAFHSPSSIRFKEQIRPLADALTLALELRGVRFVWKESGREDIGLIAEEVEKVLPEIVQRDEAGQAAGLDYGKLAALLVEALKTQQQQLSELTADYRGLLNRLARLPGAGTTGAGMPAATAGSR